MAKKILFIFNPLSGKGKIKNSLFEIVDKFTDADYDITLYPTKNPDYCERKVYECAEKYDCVVIAGGDGTLNEAVKGMLSLDSDKRVPIGYIPCGTMNDFASTNNISPDPIDAIDNIINGETIPYDIGLFNDRPFIYVAGFGAFTGVSYDTPQVSKNIFGTAAYFFEGLKSLPKIKGINTRIVIDDKEPIDTNASLVMIMNSTSVAGFDFGEFYNEIDIHDGIFEVLIVPKSFSLIDFPGVLARIRNGEREINGAKMLSAHKVIIKTEEPVKWTLDGEYGGEYTDMTFEVLHNAVEFIGKNNGGK